MPAQGGKTSVFTLPSAARGPRLFSLSSQDNKKRGMKKNVSAPFSKWCQGRV